MEIVPLSSPLLIEIDESVNTPSIKTENTNQNLSNINTSSSSLLSSSSSSYSSSLLSSSSSFSSSSSSSSSSSNLNNNLERTILWDRKLIVNNLEDIFVCPICMYIAQHPFDLICGHLFCKQCFIKHFEQQTKEDLPINCPTCREELPDDINSYKLNNTVRVLQQGWLVKCRNYESGCKWQDVMGVVQRNVIAHLKLCLYEFINCNLCNSKLLRCELEHHQKKLCDKRSIICRRCETSMPWQEEEKHIDNEFGCINIILCPRGCNLSQSQTLLHSPVSNVINNDNNSNINTNVNYGHEFTKRRCIRLNSSSSSSSSFNLSEKEEKECEKNQTELLICQIHKLRLEEHEETECLKTEGKCSISGCNYRAPRGILAQHMLDGAVKHVELLQEQMNKDRLETRRWITQLNSSTLSLESLHNYPFSHVSDIPDRKQDALIWNIIREIGEAEQNYQMNLKILIFSNNDDIVLNVYNLSRYDSHFSCQFFIKSKADASWTCPSSEVEQLESVSNSFSSSLMTRENMVQFRIKNVISRIEEKFNLSLFVSADNLISRGRDNILFLNQHHSLLSSSSASESSELEEEEVVEEEENSIHNGDEEENEEDDDEDDEDFEEDEKEEEDDDEDDDQQEEEEDENNMVFRIANEANNINEENENEFKSGLQNTSSNDDYKSQSREQKNEIEEKEHENENRQQNTYDQNQTNRRVIRNRSNISTSSSNSDTTRRERRRRRTGGGRGRNQIEISPYARTRLAIRGRNRN